MKKLLVFDFDGVIADSLDILWEFFDKINKKYKFFTFKNKDELTTLWDQNLFETVTKFGVSKEDFIKFYNEWVKLLILNTEKVKPFDELKPILEKLSQNNYLIIISSNDDKIINDFLKRNDLSEYFSSIYGTEWGISKKIKLEMALNEFKIPKGLTYFITDTIGDLKELKKFGIRTVAVTWGYHDKEKLEKARPNFIVKTPDELLELFL